MLEETTLPFWTLLCLALMIAFGLAMIFYAFL